MFMKSPFRSFKNDYLFTVVCYYYNFDVMSHVLINNYMEIDYTVSV